MNSLLNCNFSGFVQFVDFKRLPGKKFYTVDIIFALGVSADSIVSASATLYSISQPQKDKLYFIKASWIGTATPQLTIHSFEDPFPDGQPAGFDAPTPTLSGTMEVTAIKESEKWLRGKTIGYDREDNVRKQSDLILLRVDDLRWKNIPFPPVGAIATFLATIHSQQGVSAKFEAVLEDIAWVTPPGGSTSLSSGNGSSPDDRGGKRRFLGKDRNRPGPSTSSSGSSTRASPSAGTSNTASSA
ncbi:hypothetical protein CF326_g5631 [Tilletia indica]|nr:hypothetical protein CF326_g5631 [Tilletia indica]